MSDGEDDGDETEMTEEAAQRIQSHADKNDTNQDFKSRAQSAAARNEQDD